MFLLSCRTCLEQTSFSELRSLFDTYDGFVLRDAVLELFQIEVHQTDMLSTICKQCVTKLCTARDIRKQFLECNEKYRQMISNEGSDSADRKLEESLQPSASNGDPPPAVESTTQEDLQPTYEIETTNVDTDNHPTKAEEALISSGDDETSVVYVLERVDPLDEDDMGFEIKLVSESPCQAESNENYEIVELVASDSEARAGRENETTEGLEEITTDNSLFAAQRVTRSNGVTSEENSLRDLTVEYRCKRCNAISQSPELLKKHIVSCQSSHSTEEKTISQASSEEQSPSRKPLVKKKRITINERKKPSRCTTSRGAPSNSRVGAGAERTDSDEEKPEAKFKCQMCSKSFPKQSQLIRHGKVEHGMKLEVHPQDSQSEDQSTATEKPQHSKRSLHCRFCRKSFITSYALEGHENTHTREQSFYCSVCNRSFAQYTSMRRHMKIHNEIKSHKCDFCDACFRQRSVMLAHRRRHTGEKPYACDSCPKTFRDHSTFAKHRRVHQLKPNRTDGTAEESV